jgi:predicted nucleic acid-binding protein
VRFADLTAGETVFLDANPLVYYFGADPLFGPLAHQLLTRIVNGELRPYTSTHVVSEMSHHLMTLEAATVFGWTSKVVSHLKQQPANIQNLSKFRQAVERVRLLGIAVLAVEPQSVEAAAGISQQLGLLTNDGLIVAMMQQHGIVNLASNDADFDRVPWITRYAAA